MKILERNKNEMQLNLYLSHLRSGREHTNYTILIYLTVDYSSFRLGGVIFFEIEVRRSKVIFFFRKQQHGSRNFFIRV